MVRLEAEKLLARLHEKKRSFILTEELIAFLTEKGTVLEYGARPLRRAVERYLEDPLAEALLKSEAQNKRYVWAEIRDGEIAFVFTRQKRRIRAVKK